MIRCIAVDDEPLALSLLEDNISKLPFLELVGTCNNCFEAMELMQKEQTDLIFIDIQMPGMTGLQYISGLKERPLVIFITAYSQYAVDSYDLDVVDYLVKPVPLDRFMRACNRAKELKELKEAPKSLQKSQPSDHFFVNSDHSQVKIKFDDIIWMKGYGDYIKFHLKKSERPLVVRMTFKELEGQLPENLFIRIHRSYSVAINEITAIRKNSIYLGDKELAVGETYRDSVQNLTQR
ncbi:DNA-binding response regulator [Euzebyella marina]|uniref:DNA-binding response regulator n=1 Tax=Euzebyella marina TaxID=1761453 RepID=A0A3G2L581_9FLAO|nr:LytTR family DNA-binding domain-containing protein [Euzebyella marina]AYN67400.1 DNA-binding response regulator [Euzebyella marina]